MIVVLSGEGPTDLGQCRNAQNSCVEKDFQIGPMAVLLDKMLESRLNFSQRSIPDGYRYVSEGALAERARIRKESRSKVSFAGKKRDQETGYFYINAWMFAELALEIEEKRQDKVIAVLFRDCDGTRSSSPGLWASKWASMVKGFERVNFSRGVPMLPKPKSEVWLLGVAQPSVGNCSYLEEISGNDNSPNSAKQQLDDVFGAHKSGDELCEWLDGNHLDEDRLSTMPSFNAFKEKLQRAVEDVIH